MGKNFSTYMRLSSGETMRRDNYKARKGYVPVLVGREDDVVEKLWLPTKMICHPSVVALLNSSADEFGYAGQGLLKISHDVDPFKRLIKTISS